MRLLVRFKFVIFQWLHYININVGYLFAHNAELTDFEKSWTQVSIILILKITYQL